MDNEKAAHGIFLSSGTIKREVTKWKCVFLFCKMPCRAVKVLHSSGEQEAAGMCSVHAERSKTYFLQLRRKQWGGSTSHRPGLNVSLNYFFYHYYFFICSLCAYCVYCIFIIQYTLLLILVWALKLKHFNNELHSSKMLRRSERNSEVSKECCVLVTCFTSIQMHSQYININ